MKNPIKDIESTKQIEHELNAPIIETLGISKVYKIGSTMVSPVTDVSLQVGYGELVIIFGPSGAGKSTLISMLMGLEKPDVGEVFFKGVSLYNYTDEQRTIIRLKKVSYLPQTQYWIDKLSIVDNVALPLLLQGWSKSKARTKAKEYLKKVGISPDLKQAPDQLSSGQQQKVALARALIKDPWIIFADEPTAHLDSKSVEEVAQILVDTAEKQGITIVMVTHDLSFLKLSKKWLFMQDGRLWNIEDKQNPFTNIKQVIDYIEVQKEKEKED